MTNNIMLNLLHDKPFLVIRNELPFSKIVLYYIAFTIIIYWFALS